MNEFLHFLAALFGAVLRVFLWLLAAVLGLFLLALALLILLLGLVWAMLRGRRPTAPVLVGRFARYGREQVWRGAGRGRADAAASVSEVVDVEVREVGGETRRPLDGPDPR